MIGEIEKRKTVPLIKPEIQKVLTKAGLLDDNSLSSKSVDENLSYHGLDNSGIAEELAGLALRSNNESLRLRALETALKVKGALRETAAQIPTFTIIIQNTSKTLDTTQGVNPIIFPRQSLNSKTSD